MINLKLGLFFYFLVLVDVLGRYVEVLLLIICNMVFLKFLVMILKYRNYFFENIIKYLRVDNVLEFWLYIFEDFCVVFGIEYV